MTAELLHIALDFDGVLHHQLAGPHTYDEFDPTTGVEAFLEMLNARIPRSAAVTNRMEAEGVLFDHVCYLEDLMIRLPNARIILATSWREKIELKYLLQFLSPWVASSVDGALQTSHLMRRIEAGVSTCQQSGWKSTAMPTCRASL